MKKINPLVFLPGTIFWAMVITGAVTGNETIIGAAVILAAVTAVTLVVRKAKGSGARKAELRRIWTDGRVATARIVSIGTNGGGFNDHPLVDLVLEVAPEGEAPYRAEVQSLISKLAIPRIQPECTIAVRVDPGNPQKLVVDAALTPYGYN